MGSEGTIVLGGMVGTWEGVGDAGAGGVMSSTGGVGMVRSMMLVGSVSDSVVRSMRGGGVNAIGARGGMGGIGVARKWRVGWKKDSNLRW
jgi:hypothetical protein